MRELNDIQKDLDAAPENIRDTLTTFNEICCIAVEEKDIDVKEWLTSLYEENKLVTILDMNSNRFGDSTSTAVYRYIHGLIQILETYHPVDINPLMFICMVYKEISYKYTVLSRTENKRLVIKNAVNNLLLMTFEANYTETIAYDTAKQIKTTFDHNDVPVVLEFLERLNSFVDIYLVLKYNNGDGYIDSLTTVKGMAYSQIKGMINIQQAFDKD